MLLTITLTQLPATDLGYLLHKRPGRVHARSLSFGPGRSSRRARSWATSSARPEATFLLNESGNLLEQVGPFAGVDPPTPQGRSHRQLRQLGPQQVRLVAAVRCAGVNRASVLGPIRLQRGSECLESGLHVSVSLTWTSSARRMLSCSTGETPSHRGGRDQWSDVTRSNTGGPAPSGTLSCSTRHARSGDWAPEQPPSPVGRLREWFRRRDMPDSASSTWPTR